MEYLTRVLHEASKDKKFRFHPLCKSLNIINLCFADDLLLVCKANANSIQIIQKSFKAFYDASGLFINNLKSRIYFGGISNSEKASLLNLSKLTEGSFPLIYLGMPLRPTKWKAMDCDLILMKIRLRLHGWASRNLSYVGRVQLIHSVLLGIRNYWMSIFLLPQRVIKEIDWDQIWDYVLHQDSRWYWKKLIKLSKTLSSSTLNAVVIQGKLQLNKLYLLSIPGNPINNMKNVWCKLSVPKHRFILWQAINQKLLTRDLLHYCHISVSCLACLVCESELECHSHLFFDCIFSKRVFQAVAGWLGDLIWPEKFIDWCIWLNETRKGCMDRVVLAALAASVYYLWLNRNKCCFESSCFSIYHLDSLIKESVKARVSSLSLRTKKLSFREKLVIHFISSL
ncbi:uncharacterized protein LOC133779447 [Humulus lupulus]|uniref:uncharacterized protein LOC133779447 n=1 Tax=Humulus lupulus TaxID=3486 RepID=UPI002B40919E|nr:uncharacterized protein LOC133779447 [Humulus lupulus]